jgi:hypothetical protein
MLSPFNQAMRILMTVMATLVLLSTMALTGALITGTSKVARLRHDNAIGLNNEGEISTDGVADAGAKWVINLAAARSRLAGILRPRLLAKAAAPAAASRLEVRLSAPGRR